MWHARVSCRTGNLTLLSGPGAPTEGHAATIRALAFDPSGRYLLAGDDAKVCRVWDLSTGRCVRSMCVLLPLLLAPRQYLLVNISTCCTATLRPVQMVAS